MAKLPAAIASPPPRPLPKAPGEPTGFAIVIAIFLAMVAVGGIVIERALAQRRLGQGPSTRTTLSYAAPSKKSKTSTYVEYHYVGRDGVARVGNDTVPFSRADPSEVVPGRAITVWEEPALWKGPVSACDLGLERKHADGTGALVAGGWIAGWGIVISALQTRSRMRRRRLLTRGQGALATVTKFNPTGLGWRYQRIAYELEAPSGRITSQSWVTYREVRLLGKPQVGHTVAILYDPDDPATSMMYAWGAAIEG